MHNSIVIQQLCGLVTETPKLLISHGVN